MLHIWNLFKIFVFDLLTVSRTIFGKMIDPETDVFSHTTDQFTFYNTYNKNLMNIVFLYMGYLN